MNDILFNLFTRLEERGFKSAAVSSKHLSRLEIEIKTRFEKGEIDPSVYKEKFSRFSYILPEGYSSDSSIIVVAAPRGQTKLSFANKGRTIEMIYPPTYAEYESVITVIAGIITKHSEEHNYKFQEAKLPEKLLSIRSGLTEYGRNNICYINGMGSFFQLQAFFIDLPSGADNWFEPKMMAKCANCSACINKCPTGAISRERFLLYAEKCLVFHNERKKEYPFPDWIKPEWHNSIIGCMICQKFCPVDKPFLNFFEEGETFSEEETDILLSGIEFAQIPQYVKDKLERLELVDYYDALPRNLGVFFRD